MTSRRHASPSSLVIFFLPLWQATAARSPARAPARRPPLPRTDRRRSPAPTAAGSGAVEAAAPPDLLPRADRRCSRTPTRSGRWLEGRVLGWRCSRRLAAVMAGQGARAPQLHERVAEGAEQVLCQLLSIRELQRRVNLSFYLSLCQI